ncbi:MAG: hypothetical protein ABI345_03520 [Jatrophihabitans sp.]
MTQGGYPGGGDQQGGYRPQPGRQPQAQPQQGGYGPPQQGSYGQPQQGGYGPPQGGYTPAASGGRSFGVVGTILAVLGAVAGVVAFTATNWFRGGGQSHFSDVHDALDRAPGGAASTISALYFGWLAWVLLGAGLLAAIVANLPSPASGAMRAIGIIIGLAGIVLTFLATKLTSENTTRGLFDYIKEAGHAPSLYLAVGAFLLILIGSAIGPRRT